MKKVILLAVMLFIATPSTAKSIDNKFYEVAGKVLSCAENDKYDTNSNKVAYRVHEDQYNLLKQLEVSKADRETFEINSESDIQNKKVCISWYNIYNDYEVN